MGKDNDQALLECQFLLLLFWVYFLGPPVQRRHHHLIMFFLPPLLQTLPVLMTALKALPAE